MITEIRLNSEKFRNDKVMSCCRSLCRWSCHIPRVLLLTSVSLIAALIIVRFLGYWDSEAIKGHGGSSVPILAGLAVPFIFYLILLAASTLHADKRKDWFLIRILSTGLIGGTFAYLLPLGMGVSFTDNRYSEGPALRQIILYTTGGLLGIIALSETRRKNDIEEHKNNIEHIRQVEANRRERYTKSVEQLAHKEATIRMGGIYTLVRLADEWDREDMKQETQLIIDTLCSYIRSPFSLIAKYNEISQEFPGESYKDKIEDFYKDKELFRAEQNVRMNILDQIHKRVKWSGNKPYAVRVKDVKIYPGKWSSYKYDFSGSLFFYPVDLSYSYWKDEINFKNSIFYEHSNFSTSAYYGSAEFSKSYYYSNVNFSGSCYKSSTKFDHSIYYKEADFQKSTYFDETSKSHSVYFADYTDVDSTYEEFANSVNSIFCSSVNLISCTYKKGYAFSNSVYTDTSTLYPSIEYDKLIRFDDSLYMGEVILDSDTLKCIYFRDSIYLGRLKVNNKNQISDIFFESSAYTGKIISNNDFQIKHSKLMEDSRKISLLSQNIYHHIIHKTINGKNNDTYKNLAEGFRKITDNQSCFLHDKTEEIKYAINLTKRDCIPSQMHKDILEDVDKSYQELKKWLSEMTGRK